MKRAHWQALAEERVLDADALLQAARWSGAYHLAGYALECGLKACVLAHIEDGHADVIFRAKKFSENCWTHDIQELVQLAGLRSARNLDAAANPILGLNWSFASQWKETSRYDLIPEFDARRLFEAVTEPVNGVLRWIKTHW